MHILKPLLRQSKAKGGPKLVLLAIAGHIEDAGDLLTPLHVSIPRLARDTGLSERQVQNCIYQLEDAHHLVVERRRISREQTRNYYVIPLLATIAPHEIFASHEEIPHENIASQNLQIQEEQEGTQSLRATQTHFVREPAPDNQGRQMALV